MSLFRLCNVTITHSVVMLEMWDNDKLEVIPFAYLLQENIVVMTTYVTKLTSRQ